VSSISVRGGVLDEAFDPAESEFTGYFTGTTVRFTVVKDASARRARVTVSSCRRPRAGSVDCSVSVRMDGVTDVYTFTFRRLP
jgi:hypothetical protein